MYPRIVFDLSKYEHNLINIKEKLQSAGITYTCVTKVYGAAPEIVGVAEKHADYLGDSRLDNIKKMRNAGKPKVLIRIPMLSEVRDVVRYADVSLNSEYATISAINKEAALIGKVHKIIIMADLGDLREGYFEESELFSDVEKIIKLKNVEIIGIGVNLCCYGGIMPTTENLQRLVDISEKLKTRYGLTMQFVSGGASTSIYLIDRGEMPAGINNLRIGDCSITGNEFNFDVDYEDMYQDVLTFQAEIVELKQKPSIPVGIQGMDAFSGTPVFQDKGIRKRAILACGRQDVDYTQMTPKDKKVSVLGSSSDHVLLDVSDSDANYEIGDILSFRLGYSAILRAFTSPYVKKIYV